MKLPFFSTTTASSSSQSNSKNKKKKNNLSRSAQNSSFGSSSSSSDSSPATPRSVLRRPPCIGRNASCLDPEYHHIPIPIPIPIPSPSPSPQPLRLDPDGKISTTDLEAALTRLGSPEVGVADLLAEADPNGHGRVDLVDIIRGEEGEEEGLRTAFSVYDADGDGKISAEELYEVFRTIGDGSCSLAACRRMIEVVDSDGDGLVCFRDFSRMMSINSR